MKMRGNTPPAPSYSPDVAGLMRWLRQPPSQWSALGWQNAPAWADAISNLVAFLEKQRNEAIYDRDEAIKERNEAQRQYCRGFVDFCPNPAHDELSLEDAAVEVAKSFGWDCFRKDEEGEVTQ